MTDGIISFSLCLYKEKVVGGKMSNEWRSDDRHIENYEQNV